MRVVNLMLSRSIEQAKNRREHLLIELKRPKVKVGDDDLIQIKRYAYTVADDERFSKTEVEWNFRLRRHLRGGSSRSGFLPSRAAWASHTARLEIEKRKFSQPRLGRFDADECWAAVLRSALDRSSLRLGCVLGRGGRASPESSRLAKVAGSKA